MAGLIGRKLGMSQIITPEGVVVPVTYVEVLPNAIVQVKTIEKDGYNALVLGAFPEARPSKNRKFKTVREFRFDEIGSSVVGAEVSLGAVMASGDAVTVTGVSKGKGFAGTVKRYNHNTSRATHGQKYTRHGTTMNGKSTAHSRKGIPMPGQLGGDTVTLRGRQVVVVDLDRQVVGIKGALPGAINGAIFLRK